MATQQELIQKLRDEGFYTTGGHYKLVSQKHSDAYLQVRLAMMDASIRRAFTDSAILLCKDLTFDAVGAFTVGGLLLGNSIATALGLRLLVGKKGPETIEWKRDVLKKCQRLLLVDDVLTTASQLNRALSVLETSPIETITVLVAVDRSAMPTTLTFRGDEIRPTSVARLSLVAYDPSECPSCKMGIPYTNLSNPEQDFAAVLLSRPMDQAEMILKGYETVYRLQEDHEQLELLAAWKPWLPILVAGLPSGRLQEDSSLVQFVTRLTDLARESGIKTRVLSEIIGQLMSLSLVRVESRAVGCSLLVGDDVNVLRILESRGPAEITGGLSVAELAKLVPYCDGFHETHFAFVLDGDGRVRELRRLVYARQRSSIREGTELLRWVTSQTRSVGFVLRRGRSSVAVYYKGRLEGVAELSERTGQWEFARPMERIDEIDRKLPGIVQVLAIILEAGRELNGRGQGALIIVGDTDGLEHTPPKIRLTPQPISEIPIDELVELAKLDGALLVSRDGTLKAATVIIQNTQTAEEESATGERYGGSRKETARRTSMECPHCAAVYISQNGTIEIYVQGRSWPIADAIAGLSLR